ncbi:Transcription factor atf21 [Trichoderma ghanense]|uniref:Transcription factor atf21 n=1 Tax=Trichoderma ghanense TaxID=65468 RepID=A0ABY2GTD7_9HYPO
MPFPVVQSPVFFPLAIDKKEAAMGDDLFGEYGLGIHDNITGFPFDFSVDAGLDPIAVDPGLTLSPYGTTPPDSHFTTPQSVPLLSPGSSIEYFGDHRSSIGSIDSTVAPHEVSTRAAIASSSHNTKRPSSQPTKTKPDAASTTATSTTKTTDTPAAANADSAKPSTDASTTNSSTMMTRTRKAAAQNADAAPAEAQPRPKRQKTAASTQSTKIKQEPQQQQQTLPLPKRKLARRGPAAKREDTAQRTKNLERNRIAASKCRQKKKEWVMELEETKSGMEIRHTNLRLEYLTLLDEVTRIKNQLMAHAACNDPNINFWIEKEALRYVERCMDPPAAAAASGSAAASASASAPERRPSTALPEPAAAESCTLPSPSESQTSNLESPVSKHEGINLDYMPEELLSGDAV